LPLSHATRDALRGYLYKEVSRFVKEQISNVREKPFHVRLMPGLAEVRFSERSFSTRSGSWFQQIAKIIATQFHAEVHLNFLVEGRIQAAAAAHIEQITEAMDHGQPKRKPNRLEDIKEVLMVQSPGGADKSVRSDLFVLRHDQSEMYFEMKTPDPNKGQCKKMKQDILLIMALRKGAKAEAYAAAAYNPYGDDKRYMNNFVMQFLEIGKDMLIGRDFWTLIGDQNTYDELLEISGEVGKEIEKLIANIK
jgi:hypothetical protein